MNWGILIASPFILVGGILALLVLLILILTVFPLKVDVLYEESNLFVKLKILFFTKVLVDPTKEKKPKKEKAPKKPKKEKKAKEKKPEQTKKEKYFTLAKVGYAGLKVLAKGGPLTVDKLYLKVTFGGDDPADLGILFGKVHTALGIAWPVLQRIIVVKDPSIQTDIDFMAESTEFQYARVVVPIPLLRILHIALTVLLCYSRLTQEDEKTSISQSSEQKGRDV